MPRQRMDRQTFPDTFSLERQLYAQGYAGIAGIDEAGRGPLAGPVLAACVVLPRDCEYQAYRDSKVLSAGQREQLYAELRASSALIGTGSADAREIEEINILQASLLAMQRALAECMKCSEKEGRQIDYLLIDGRSPLLLDMAQRTLIKGESKSASIAAASIIAKVERDRLMEEAHQHYPLYGFAQHQGYPTKLHRQALSQHGPCPLHRRTFNGVREFFASQEKQERAACAGVRPRKMNRGKTGALGEAFALAYLRQQGYSIITQNYRRPFGEIDIIAYDRGTVVFVEVKTRHCQQYGSPAEAVDQRKQRRLSQTALDYLTRHNLTERSARFDVVAVYLNGQEQADRIELIQNAFECVDLFLS